MAVPVLLDGVITPLNLADVMTENSMKSAEVVGSTVTIDVKKKCQYLVLSETFSKIEKVECKLISQDLPDKTLYSLSGEDLRMILQERIKPLAEVGEQQAIIPLSLSGNLNLSEENYIQIKVDLYLGEIVPVDENFVEYDRVISAFDGKNPLFVKRVENENSVESEVFDEIIFTENIPDVTYNEGGKKVYIPQLLLHSKKQILGIASLSLVSRRTYDFSCKVNEFLLVEY